MTRPDGVNRPPLLPGPDALRTLVGQLLSEREEAGADVGGLAAALESAGGSYDALLTVATELGERPIRADFPYTEPEELAGITASWSAESLSPRPPGPDATDRIRTAFLARVAGCVLGKPFEFDPTGEELRAVLEPAGEWPLSDYVTEATNARLRSPQPQSPECVRERLAWVCEDDDINYTVLAMLLLERQGPDFTPADLQLLWLRQLPLAATFGPERTHLIGSGLDALLGGTDEAPAGARSPGRLLHPGMELCGALIRADAYGYAYPGDPARAATLAYRDARCTHRGSGVYGAMFVAAAIAAALVTDATETGNPARLDPLRTGLAVVPPHSRLAETVRHSLDLVAAAADWWSAYQDVHTAYGRFGHCRIYQEVGTLAVTLRFAEDVGHGLGLQVCQGNDTDSFGATAGSLLGALLGPTRFDPRWLAPFRDEIHLALAMFHERSLSALAARVAGLPGVVAGWQLGPQPS
ncbi:MAG TPA: ADP-ribosylglycohydrolase family protein [Mycobacteriales bacterium]|nr:ADP-ribosylglycohydrolase family protein [Mycobacteriales bacterium]